MEGCEGQATRNVCSNQPALSLRDGPPIHRFSWIEVRKPPSGGGLFIASPGPNKFSSLKPRRGDLFDADRNEPDALSNRARAGHPYGVSNRKIGWSLAINRSTLRVLACDRRNVCARAISPEGTAEINVARVSLSVVPSGRSSFYVRPPNVETLGYSRSIPPG